MSDSATLRCTRRQFLASAGAATLLLSIEGLSFSPAVGGTAGDAAVPAPHVPEYRTWEDVYRQQWRWDTIVHNSHECNCNNACSWCLYVRDGVVWREEQTAAAVQSITGLPDFNPQGCEKGATHSHQMYSHTRIKYPLKRVGERGSGRWERISWDQALTEIATQLIEIIRDDGHDTICCFAGTQAGGASKGGVAKSRFVDLVGGVFMEVRGEIGDSHNGAIITAGRQGFDGGSDTRMYSKCLVLWAYNPVATRIPDCHHLWEARYHGATVISISPDYNPSAVHADYWVNPKPGTDPALALAMASVIVRDKLYDVAHLKEQTDLPFLVRDDTRTFLRASEIDAGGRNDVFYVWDLSRGGLGSSGVGARVRQTGPDDGAAVHPLKREPRGNGAHFQRDVQALNAAPSPKSQQHSAGIVSCAKPVRGKHPVAIPHPTLPHWHRLCSPIVW